MMANSPDRLLIACQKGDPAVVRALIEDEGISANHANMIKQSALHVAAWWANDECIQVLLEHNADVHAQNTMTGSTPLHCSLQSSKAALVKSRRISSIQLLLQYGADPTAVDFSERMPLDYLEEDDIDRKDILELFVDYLTDTKKEIPPIFEAIATQSLDRLQECLSNTNKQPDQSEIDYSPLNHIFQDFNPLLRLTMDWCYQVESEDEREKQAKLRQSQDFFSTRYGSYIPPHAFFVFRGSIKHLNVYV